MEKGQLVRLTKKIEGAVLEKGTVGFVIESHDDKIAMMGLDEEGVILGAGIFDPDVLEVCDDDAFIEAQKKYDSRLEIAKAQGEQGRRNMIRTVANETGFGVEDVTRIIDVWENLHHDIVQTLR